jgi:hypothetical protein
MKHAGGLVACLTMYLCIRVKAVRHNICVLLLCAYLN